MKKIALLLFLAFGASGCAQLQILTTAYDAVVEATVTPKQIVIVANAFNALQGTATQYLVYCKTRRAESICAEVNLRTVIKSVHAGRAARNQLEVYLTENRNAPSQVYNTLVAVVNSLSKSAATKVGGL